MLRGTEGGLGPGHIVLDGDPAHPPKGNSSHLHFSAHIYWGQRAGWIKVPLGTEVGPGPGDIVLDGDPAAPTVRLWGFRHTSTSGFGVGTSWASFIAVFAIACTDIALLCH